MLPWMPDVKEGCHTFHTSHMSRGIRRPPRVVGKISYNCRGGMPCNPFLRTNIQKDSIVTELTIPKTRPEQPSFCNSREVSYDAP